MKRRWILLVLIVMFLTAPSVGLAEDLDSKQMTGSWKGTTPSPASGSDYWELCLKDNGTLSGDLQSVRGGLLNVSGTYEIAGDSLKVQGQTSRPGGRGTFIWTLKDTGTELQGTGTQSQEGFSGGARPPFPVSLKKAKPSC